MFDDSFVMRSRLWALFLVLGACTKPNPASCLDDFCDDPALPFCDADGSIGGTPDTCIAVECTPDAFEQCQGDQALVCSTDGTTFKLFECEFGCGEDGCLPCNTPECLAEKHVIPAYLPTGCDGLATTALTVTEDLVIDTSDDASCSAIVVQPNGPSICVLHHTSISVAENQVVRVTGTRVLALVADQDFDLLGILDASAGDDFTNGPGGGFKKSGGGGAAGGGGAGNRTPGGHGGTTNTNGGALNGGVAEPNPVGITKLFGAPQSTHSGGPKPGGSGGGVTLISCRGTLSIVGLVDVNGGGGQASVGGVSNGGPIPPIVPPAGGGAGGNLILQGMRVVVEGQIFANGGGGGSGGTPFDGRSNGQRGQRSVVCATGGPSQQGDGGFGGCVSMAPTEGQGGSANSNSGGGGGSAGYLLTYTPEGVTPMLNPLAVSPAFEPNSVIPTN